MIRVGVFGAAGRMGARVRSRARGPIELVATVDPLHAGLDLRLAAQVDGDLQVAAPSSALVDAGAEVVVDFT